MMRELMIISQENLANGVIATRMEVEPTLTEQDILNLLTTALCQQCSHVIRTHNCGGKECNIEYIASEILNKLNQVIDRKENR